MKTKQLFISLSLGLGLTLALLWLLSASTPFAHADSPHHVALDCTDVPPPCHTTVQEAVDAASDGDVIKVATGIYTGGSVRAAVTQVVYISKSVTIRGGYTTAFTEPPNPETNPTTLDAQDQGRVLFITGDISPTIEGLRITGGNAAGLGGGPWPRGGDAGGGLFLSSITATLSSNTVFSNTAGAIGGGLFLYHSTVTLSGNIISDNYVSQYGGGLGMYYSDATIISNTISDNSANWGGGLDLWYSDNVTINDNIILSNTARAANGGGLYFVNSSSAILAANTISENGAANGGGLYFERSPGATLTSNSIIGNGASGWGNTNVGGGLVFQSSDNMTLTDNVIRGNWGRDYGGGLAFRTCDNIKLAANIIADNSSRRGGGLSVGDSDVTMTNNILADNQADMVGSGLYITRSSTSLLHTTIARNSGGDGSGVYVTNDGVTYSTVAMTNTILVSHTVGITVAAGNTAMLEATLWGTDDWANLADWGGAGTLTTGTINLWGAPDFAGDYHIGSNSAAIDAGVNAGVGNDIDGESRPSRTGYDLGADEFWYKIYLPIILKSH